MFSSLKDIFIVFEGNSLKMRQGPTTGPARLNRATLHSFKSQHFLAKSQHLRENMRAVATKIHRWRNYSRDLKYFVLQTSILISLLYQNNHKDYLDL